MMRLQLLGDPALMRQLQQASLSCVTNRGQYLILSCRRSQSLRLQPNKIQHGLRNS